MFRATPDVVKNLIIINVIVLLGSYSYGMMTQQSLNYLIGIFYWDSPNFRPFQFVTHIFAHGDFFHLLFNMYALWMFGSILERVWGPQKFLFYYLSCGLGASFISMGVDTAYVYSLADTINPTIAQINQNADLARIYSIPAVGASGAVYGLLLAFGMTFPNEIIRLLFPPVALKAKYFVLIFGALELFLSVANAGGSIGHIAHLGGMLIGFVLLKAWGKPR